jgi:hypothetical protein
MIVYFDFLINLVVLANQLFDGILLDHVENIPFGIKIGRIDIHFKVEYGV